jgi:hypothetical protein
MATKFESVSGSYDQKPEDSNTQASNKFSHPSLKTTDDLPKPSHKGSKPTDSKDHSIG